MKIFRDGKGREWAVDLTISGVKRINARFDIDMLGDIEIVLQRLISDPIFLVDVLYTVCETQAKSIGCSDEAFGESMAGDVILHGRNALMEAITDFFPSPADRQAVAAAIECGLKLVAAIRRKGSEMLAAMDVDRIAEELVAATHGEQSTNSPESSELLPKD